MLAHATETKLNNYLQMFKDMTLEEANQIIKRHDSIIAEKVTETDKVIKDNLQTFQALVDTAVQSVTKDME